MWQFRFSDGAVLQVHCGSGHWAHTVTISTGEIGKAIYVYEATMTTPGRPTKEMWIRQSDLRRLRRTHGYTPTPRQQKAE